MADRSFLILHGFGYDGDPAHWHAWLERSLRERGERVARPLLPDPERPSLAAWSEIASSELEAMAGERIVIAHSLGVLTWIHLSPSLEGPVERLLLVSPPEDAEVPAGGEQFHVGDFDPAPLRASCARAIRLVRGEGDPYSPGGVPPWAEEAGCEVDAIAGAEHLNPDDGYGEWPSLLAWCEEPGTRITARVHS
ncbi:MAG: alpha/beta hydrolase [Solirubrobacterales bacterium]